MISMPKRKEKKEKITAESFIQGKLQELSSLISENNGLEPNYNSKKFGFKIYDSKQISRLPDNSNTLGEFYSLYNLLWMTLYYLNNYFSLFKEFIPFVGKIITDSLINMNRNEGFDLAKVIESCKQERLKNFLEAVFIVVEFNRAIYYRYNEINQDSLEYEQCQIYKQYYGDTQIGSLSFNQFWLSIVSFIKENKTIIPSPIRFLLPEVYLSYFFDSVDLMRKNIEAIENGQRTQTDVGLALINEKAGSAQVPERMKGAAKVGAQVPEVHQVSVLEPVPPLVPDEVLLPDLPTTIQEVPSSVLYYFSNGLGERKNELKAKRERHRVRTQREEDKKEVRERRRERRNKYKKRTEELEIYLGDLFLEEKRKRRRFEEKLGDGELWLPLLFSEGPTQAQKLPESVSEPVSSVVAQDPLQLDLDQEAKKEAELGQEAVSLQEDGKLLKDFETEMNKLKDLRDSENNYKKKQCLTEFINSVYADIKKYKVEEQEKRKEELTSGVLTPTLEFLNNPGANRGTYQNEIENFVNQNWERNKDWYVRTSKIIAIFTFGIGGLVVYGCFYLRNQCKLFGVQRKMSCVLRQTSPIPS